MQKEVYEYISEKSNPAKNGAGDSIIERRTCRMSGEEFAIFQSDKAFYEKMSPTFAGKRYTIPFPTLCPDERLRRRMCFRNERSLYRGICGATGDRMLSCYSPEKNAVVYNFNAWWSDNWDPFSFGRNYDLGSSFFAQFTELDTVVPKMNLINGQYNVGSQYVNQTDYVKNCHLCFDADQTEDSLYCNTAFGVKRSIDCSNAYYSENCYQCVNITKGFNLLYCVETNNSSHCSFSYRCDGCQYCFGCVNLINQKYCIYNKQYTQQEYELLIQKEWEKFREAKLLFMTNLETFINQQPQRATYTIKSSNTTGSNIYQSGNVKCCYNIGDAKDVAYCTMTNEHIQDCYDYTIWGSHAQKIIDSITVGLHAHGIGFSYNCRENITNLRYCINCIACKDCFGCVGLRNKQYCIGNKQYTKASYEAEVAGIIEGMIVRGEWGEFFPITMSPFGYNETIAQLYFPLEKEDAEELGYPRQSKIYNPTISTGTKTIIGSALPPIDQVDESILDIAIICESSGRPFKLQKTELEFYKKHYLPLPSLHYEERYKLLKKKEPQMTMYLRTCDKTGEEILSVYPAGAPFDVYSEEAYRQEIYG